MTRKAKRPPLTESEWRKVFDLRCRTKRGEYMSPEDMKLCTTAYAEDPKRYSAMTRPAHNAALPYGAFPLEDSDEQD